MEEGDFLCQDGEALNTSAGYQAEEDFAPDSDANNVFKQEPWTPTESEDAGQPDLDPLIDDAIEEDGIMPQAFLSIGGDGANGGKSIDCRYCDFTTSTFEGLNSHMATVHRSQPHAKRVKLQNPHQSEQNLI